MTVLRTLVLALIGLALALPVSAQATRGRVQGTVVDTTGGVLPGVTVTLQNDGTGIAVTRQSGANGHYLFDQVDPGMYTATAELSGFGTVVQKNVRVQQRGDVTVDITLAVSGLVEDITVVVESPTAVQFNTSKYDMTVEETLIKGIPLATRNPATLAQLDPSINGAFDRSANFDHYAANAYDIGGQSAGRNDVLIDGAPVVNSAKLAYNPPVDAVAEYSIVPNAVDAEYGHSAGGIVTMSLKSGSNTLRGSAYYYGSDPSLNAVSNRITRQHSQNTYWNTGGTVGMPLKKNRLFMFTVFEKQTDTSFRALNYTLPTALERQGDFSQSFNADGSLRVIYDPLTSRIEGGRVVRDPFPGNRIPANRWDPLAVKILSNLWMPNNAGDNLAGLNNYKYGDERYYQYWNFSTRVDWHISDRWKAFGRVSTFQTDQPANDYTNGADALKMRRTEGSQRDGINLAMDSVYTINATTALTVRGAYYKTVDRRNYPEMNIGEEGYRDLWPNGWWQPYIEGRPIVYFPNMQIPSGDTFGVRNFWWQQPHGSSVSAKLDKYFGRHALKAGTDVRFKRGDAARYFFTNLIFTANNTANTTSGANVRTGYEWASFLLGAMDPTTAVSSLPTSTQFTPLQESNTEMYAFFVQDDFRVTQNLTLNVGLRYEYEGGFWDTQNRLPQRLDLTDPIPGMQAAISPALAALQAGNTGKTITQVMAESAGQSSHVYNGAFYFAEDGNRRATTADKLQLMPRIGLAYRVDDKTAVRLGYGRFYTPSSLTDSGNEPLGQYDLAAFSPTTSALPLDQGVPQAYLSNPFPQGLTPVYGKAYGRYTNLGDAITIDEHDRRPPISDRINLSLQREVWARAVVDVTYLFNFTNRNLLDVHLNRMDPRLSYTYGVELTRTVPNPFFNYGAVDTFPGGLRRQATVPVSQLLRPYPQYGDILQTSTDLGKYRYQSLQFRVQRPFLNGFSFLVAYAYNREKSELFYDDQDTYDGILSWVDTVNPRHRVTSAFTAEVPVGRDRKLGKDIPQALDLIIGGWQVAGTFLYRSGQFLRFAGMVAPESVRKIGDTGANGYWFDVTGFDRLAAYTRRTNPYQYDNLTGPALWNMDAVLSKGFRMTGSTRLEFRLEAYNVFNNINWANPVTNVAATNFGRTNALVTATSGRRLQYALRLEF
jgi:hypothetical protein